MTKQVCFLKPETKLVKARNICCIRLVKNYLNLVFVQIYYNLASVNSLLSTTPKLFSVASINLASLNLSSAVAA